MTLATVVSSVKAFATNATTAPRQWHARRHLENQLLRYRNAAAEYERNHIPAGHSNYQELLALCSNEIADYAEHWHQKPHDVELEFPFLVDLQRKAHPSLPLPSKGVLPKLIAAFAGISLVLVVSGAGSALVHAAYVHVSRWLGA